MKRSGRLAVVVAIASLATGTGAQAQYTYDAGNIDELPNSTRYFGSIKDEKGKPLTEAGVIAQKAYVFMTDVTGRFSGWAPDAWYKQEVIGCSKAGYTVVRVTKRFGVTDKKNWVQVDCVLRKPK